MMRSVRFAFLTGLVVLGVNCTESDDPTSPQGILQQGTWGGDDVVIIVEAALAHVHVGCTNGDFTAPIRLDEEGRFNVAGSYMLRAFPIPIGPTVPAQMAGQVSGRRLVFTVAVNDTVGKELVVFGPSTVTLGREPQMGPCPICVGRGQRAMGRMFGAKRKAQSAKGPVIP